MSKNIKRIILAAVFGLLTQPAWSATILSDFKKIGLIQMGDAQVYFQPVEGKWGGGCPNATWAYYNKSKLATDKEYLSTILASKAAQYEVRVRGVCSSNGNYIELDIIYVR